MSAPIPFRCTLEVSDALRLSGSPGLALEDWYCGNVQPSQ
jgi:hypothetical protein